MRRFLGLKDSTNTHSSNAKGKERQRDPTTVAMPLPESSPSLTPMEVHVSTEIHSAPDRLGFHPHTSTISLTSSSPASSDSQPLPPEIRVPTHPYPYWQGYTHTPSSSSQSSLESPMTPSHVSWLSSGNGNTLGHNAVNNSSHTNLTLTNPASVPQPSAGPSSSSHSLVQGRSSPSPHFPPPPQTSPPPNLVARPKLIHPTKSSHSLRVPVQEFFNQQLSPIVEQDYLSPEKRPVSLPSSSHEGGSRTSTAHTVRTSAALTPISTVCDGIGSATVTPVTPVPITPVLFGVRGSPATPQMQTPVTPSCPGGVVPFARMKEEEGNDSPRPSPVSTFILRPLNRSISLSSVRTHQTTASSATPPVIPPLDLKPEFKGQTFLMTPTSLHSRGLLDIAARDDDSISDKRESFVTARTGANRESRYSLGQDEVFVDAEEGFRRDSDGTIHQFESRLLEDNADTTPTPPPQPMPENPFASVKQPVSAHTIMHPHSASRSSPSPPSYNHPLGPHSSDSHLHPDRYPRPHRPTVTPPPALHPSRLGASAPSLHDLGSSISTSSSFIDRRFALSSLYLPPPSERESAHKASSRWALHFERVNAVQVLFWLGFVAPWCWLIGGWLVSPKPSSPLRTYNEYYHRHHNGRANGLGTGGSTLPLWTNTSKSMASLDTTRMRQHGYPFVAPSVSSLMPPPPPYQSQRGGPTAMVLMPKPVVGPGMRWSGKNPWVRRCRIAAVVSGVVIAIVFLVALVVALTTHAA